MKTPLLALLCIFILIEPVQSNSEVPCKNYHKTVYLQEKDTTKALGLFYNLLHFNKNNTYSGFVSLRKNIEEIWTFYDTPNLLLKEQGVSLYLIEKKIGENIKHYSVAIEQTEKTGNISFQYFEAKPYNRKLSSTDIHPLIGWVKRDVRNIFIDVLTKQLKIEKPLELKKTLNVQRIDNSVIINYVSTPVIKFSVISSEIKQFGVSSFIHEVNYSDFSCQLMDSSNMTVLTQLKLIQTSLKQFINSINKIQIDHYSTFSKSIGTILPFWPYWIKYPLFIKIIQAIILIVFSLMILYILLNKYTKAKK